MLTGEKDRRVIPRWRQSRVSAALGEMDSLRLGEQHPLEYDEPAFEHKIREWKNERSISFASDVVATALSVGLEDNADATEAASFVANNPDAPTMARSVANRFLQTEEPSADLLETTKSELVINPLERHLRIRVLRKYLSDSPRNVFVRVDLALEYTSLGMVERALRTMSTAVRLAPDNRFVLRSAARLLVHAGDTDDALKVLRDSSRTQGDPWLVAAEVATASVANRPSRFAKKGLVLLDSAEITPFHTAELASAIGTLEAESGQRRNARRLFRKSLVDPNENSVAQARWAAEHLDFDEFDPKFLEVPGSFEARALDRVKAGRLSDGVHETWRWLHDQPFSKTAAIFGSYLASVGIDDHQEALRFLSAASAANPKDSLLTNNLAFAYASDGRIAEAEAALASLPESLEPEMAATVQATRGLVLFRQGAHIAGRLLYLNTIDTLERLRQKRSAAIAKVFRAREETLAGTSETADALLVAQEACKDLDAPEIIAALKRVEKMAVDKAGSSTPTSA